MQWNTFAKAIVGGLIAAGTAVATGLQSDGLSGAEAVTAAVALLVGFQGVYWVKNSNGQTE